VDIQNSTAAEAVYFKMFSRYRTKHAFSLQSIGIKKPKGEAGSSAIAIIVGLFVAFGGVLFGYDDASMFALAVIISSVLVLTL
jgi:hypothetical protein